MSRLVVLSASLCGVRTYGTSAIVQSDDAMVLAPTTATTAANVTATPQFNGLISWLHIPKCGSTFVSAITGAFCPAAPDDLSPTCTVNTALSYEKKEYTETECSAYDGDVPFCTGSKPYRSQMLYGVLASYYLRCPASNCLPGFQWDDGNTYPNGQGKSGIHRPLPKHAEPAFFAGVVTMLRAPRQRLISAFYDGNHGCFNTPALAETESYGGACNSATFARIPGYWGCAAASITHCKSIQMDQPIPHCRSSQTVVAEATRRVRAFGFVGLVEDWNTSINLFHITYGGVTKPSELADDRKGSSGTLSLPAPGCDFVSSWYDESELDPSVGLGNATVVATPTAELDPLDTAVYALAVSLFYQRAHAAGLIDAVEKSHRMSCLLGNHGTRPAVTRSARTSGSIVHRAALGTGSDGVRASSLLSNELTDECHGANCNATCVCAGAALDATCTDLKQKESACNVLHEYVEHISAVFIHVPKNAGTSIEAASTTNGTVLSPVGMPWHGTAASMAACAQPPLWSAVPSFAVLREPVDRAISLYDYTMQADNYKFPWVRESGSFDAFVEHLAARSQQQLLDDRVGVGCHDFFAPQSTYVFGEHGGEPLVSHLLCTETLTEGGWAALQEKIPSLRSYSLPEVTRASTPTLTPANVSGSTRRLLTEVLYARDVQLWNTHCNQAHMRGRG